MQYPLQAVVDFDDVKVCNGSKGIVRCVRKLSLA